MNAASAYTPMSAVPADGVGDGDGDGVAVAVGVGVGDTVPSVGIVRLLDNSAVVNAVRAMPTTISVVIIAEPFCIFIL